MQTGLPEQNAISKPWYIIRALFILIFISFTTCLVYFTGGANYSFTHFMYAPIILSAYYFGIQGTVVAALLGGLALGPFMPQHVVSGMMQPSASWIFRIAIFVIVGIMCSLIFKHIQHYKEAEIAGSYVNTMTGFPNIIKMKADLDKLIYNKTEFSFIGFRVVNINSIKQNISYDIAIKSLIRAMELLAGLCNRTVYSIYANEFAVILPGSSMENAQILGKQFLEKTLEPFLIDQFKIGLLIKGGGVSFPLQAKDSHEMINKTGIVLDQATGEIGLYVYDDILEQKSKNQSELVPDLLHAIQYEEFSLVYQPKGSLNFDKTMRAEALLRWNHPTRGQISPGEFIKIAEETGLIGEITKWVIKNVIDQKEKWKQAGLEVKVALNISPKDLNNGSVINYLIEMIEKKGLDLSLLELELTERDILENIEMVIPLFNDFRKRGIKIALDDYGTGYTSLVNLFRLPMDYIKVDKSFIDRITDPSYRLAVEQIIEIAHKMKKEVIAEGVESKEQVNILRDLGCDYIQGYYLSKPLSPDELIQFYSVAANHQMNS